MHRRDFSPPRAGLLRSATERYTLEMAEMVAPHRVYCIEECLQPHNYGLWAPKHRDQDDADRDRRARIHTLRVSPASRAPLGGRLAARCSLVRRTDRAPARRRTRGCIRFPRHPAYGWHVRLCSLCYRRRRTAPGPSFSFHRREDRRRSIAASRRTIQITRGPEGVYTRPSDRPRLGWDLEVI